MSFTFLKYANNRALGKMGDVGSKDSIFSSLYSKIRPAKVTDGTPCDGQDWGAVFGFGFSPDGSLLAAACENKCLLLYDPNNARLIHRRFQTHTDCVNCVRFLDGRTFATCSDDSTVRLWDFRFLSSEIRILRGHSSWVKNIEYCCRDGKLITSGFDGNIFAWDINNYSENEKAEPLFYINGMMRTKITPDESKMIVSTLRGYFLLIHDLQLEFLKEDLAEFVPHRCRLMQLMKSPLHQILEYNYMFSRSRNRVEFVCDFPEQDNADSISTMQVHPQGWCVSSRNTTLDEESEWTCIHDIQPYENGHKSDIIREETSSPDNEFMIHCADLLSEASSTQASRRSRIIERDNIYDNPSVFWDLQSPRNSVSYSEFLNEVVADGGDISDDVSSDDDDNRESSELQRQPSYPYDPDEFSVEIPSWFRSSYFPSNISSRPNNSEAGEANVSPASSMLEPAAALRANLERFVTSMQQDFRREQNELVHSEGSELRGNDGADGGQAPDRLNFDEVMGRRVRRSRELAPSANNHMKITYVKPRLLFYSEEPNIGRGFIKEQSFSSDGRVLASPFGNCVRLLAFNSHCSELCDCVPAKPTKLTQVAMTVEQKSSILASTFSPNHCLFVAGARDGSISFCSPKL